MSEAKKQEENKQGGEEMTVKVHNVLQSGDDVWV